MTASDSRKVQKIVYEVDPIQVPYGCEFYFELSRDALRKMFAERFTYSNLTQHENLVLGGFAHVKRAMHRAKSERRKRKRLGTGTEGMARNDLHRRHSRIGENDTVA